MSDKPHHQHQDHHPHHGHDGHHHHGNHGHHHGHHGHEHKTVTIVVEGTAHEWPKDEEITYEQVVKLEVPEYSPTSGINYAVKYTNGPAHKPIGVLSLGGSVKVKEGMVFSVSETGLS